MIHFIKCGCEIATEEGIRAVPAILTYCETHAAAPAMLAALERVQDGLTLLEPEFRSEPLAVIGTMQEAIRDAITQARKGGA